MKIPPKVYVFIILYFRSDANKIYMAFLFGGRENLKKYKFFAKIFRFYQ